MSANNLFSYRICQGFRITKQLLLLSSRFWPRKSFLRHKVSISSTFYIRIFCMNIVFLVMFLLWTNFCTKKFACLTLMKLTAGVVYSKQISMSKFNKVKFVRICETLYIDKIISKAEICELGCKETIWNKCKGSYLVISI